jgi:LuxR family transcriptional regulator
MIICSEASFSKYEGFRLFPGDGIAPSGFRLTCAAEVYQELERQTQALEFDYYALCVRHPVPFTRPKISLQTTYPKLWMAQYQSANYFAIDPVLKPENFIQGHLPWTDALFAEAQELWHSAQDHGLRSGITQCLMLPNHALGFLSVSRTRVQEGPLAHEEIGCGCKCWCKWP